MSIQAGVRILVVEDKPFRALYIADLVADLGHTVIGPAFSHEEAWRLASNCNMDTSKYLVFRGLGGRGDIAARM